MRDYMENGVGLNGLKTWISVRTFVRLTFKSKETA